MLKSIKVAGLALALMLGSFATPAYASSMDAPAPVADGPVSVESTDVINVVLQEGKVVQLPAAATSIFVADPEVADVQVKSSTVVYIFGRAPGSTSFYAVDSEDNVVVKSTIVVGYNLGALRSAIRDLTKSDDVRISQVRDMIMLSGKVDNTSLAQDIARIAIRYLPTSVTRDLRTSADLQNVIDSFVINRLQVSSSNQVNIRVRIAEVSRGSTKDLGIGTNVANPSVLGDVDLSFGFDAGVTLVGAAGTGGLGATWGATTITAALDALVTDGYATILAEPNLTALSGETASFLAGGEFPIPVPDGSGNITIEFRPYGVSLAFTPTVLEGGRISLRVRPEVSQRDDSGAVSFSGGSIPGILTRRAETSVELGSGQSFAIAGLLQNNLSQNIDKYPGLGDLPILGALFRSDRYRRNETELVIVVTPYLVKPVNASQVMVPTDGFVPPNDIDRWLNGRLNSEVPTPAPVPTARPVPNVAAQGGLVGDVGYVVQ